jgi:hypothetical protein
MICKFAAVGPFPVRPYLTTNSIGLKKITRIIIGGKSNFQKHANSKTPKLYR